MKIYMSESEMPDLCEHSNLSNNPCLNILLQYNKTHAKKQAEKELEEGK